MARSPTTPQKYPSLLKLIQALHKNSLRTHIDDDVVDWYVEQLDDGAFESKEEAFEVLEQKYEGHGKNLKDLLRDRKKSIVVEVAIKRGNRIVVIKMFPSDQQILIDTESPRKVSLDKGAKAADYFAAIVAHLESLPAGCELQSISVEEPNAVILYEPEEEAASLFLSEKGKIIYEDAKSLDQEMAELKRKMKNDDLHFIVEPTLLKNKKLLLGLLADVKSILKRGSARRSA